LQPYPFADTQNKGERCTSAISPLTDFATGILSCRKEIFVSYHRKRKSTNSMNVSSPVDQGIKS
jgi:hypothetical protein